MRIVFWASGHIAEYTVKLDMLKKLPHDVEVMGFADNDKAKWGKDIGGYTILSPSQVKELNVDSIIILSDDHFAEIYNMLVNWLHIAPTKIKRRVHLLKLMLINKYSDTDDREIHEILKYWENHEIGIYNQYVQRGNEINDVYWDNIENMPYIVFEDKRMYFPYNYNRFVELDGGKKVYKDLMCEQQPTSPHLYIKGDIKIDVGDVIVDAGVCEGNFALRYVEKASKVYLIEGDRKWFRPLEKTFEKFKDKVILCKCFLGRGDTERHTCLDSIVKGRLDFLKMDIEGSEVDALIGGRQTLMNNDVKCSICSYHRINDEHAIADILRAYGYKTSHSDGYMVFWPDKDIWSCPELRRGIVYGVK
jgi:hypothetical protein